MQRTPLILGWLALSLFLLSSCANTKPTTGRDYAHYHQVLQTKRTVPLPECGSGPRSNLPQCSASRGTTLPPCKWHVESDGNMLSASATNTLPRSHWYKSEGELLELPADECVPPSLWNNGKARGSANPRNSKTNAPQAKVQPPSEKDAKAEAASNVWSCIWGLVTAAATENTPKLPDVHPDAKKEKEAPASPAPKVSNKEKEPAAPPRIVKAGSAENSEPKIRTKQYTVKAEPNWPIMGKTTGTQTPVVSLAEQQQDVYTSGYQDSKPRASTIQYTHTPYIKPEHLSGISGATRTSYTDSRATLPVIQYTHTPYVKPEHLTSLPVTDSAYAYGAVTQNPITSESHHNYVMSQTPINAESHHNYVMSVRVMCTKRSRGAH